MIHTRILPFITGALLSCSLHAQLYTIPDAAFATFLQQNFPQVMVGEDLDTSAPELPAIVSMTIFDDSYQLHSLDGLQFFTGLDTLNLYDLSISTPAFPEGLIYLGVFSGDLGGSGWELPSSLLKIELGDYGSFYTDDPIQFPAGLQTLHLGSANYIGGLVLNAGLDTLIIDSESAEIMGRMNGQPWPTALKYLKLGGSAVEVMPVPSFGNTALEYLYIGFTVADLGPMPSTLKELYIRGSATHCVPLLPDGMVFFYAEQYDPEGWIDCLSNQPAGMTVYSGSSDPFSVCTIWNSSCFGGNTISGQVFLDNDADGTFDGSDLPILNRTVSVTPGPVFTSSGAGGLYDLPVHAGSFLLAAEAGDHDGPLSAPTPISFNDVGLTSSGNALPMTASMDVADLGVSATTAPARPGFENEVWLTVNNHGTSLLGGELSFTFNDPQEWMGSEEPATVVGNTASWVLPPLQLGEQHTFALTLLTPLDVVLGTPVMYSTTITASGTDDMADNDNALVLDTVVGSFDPNDIRVEPTTLTPSQVVEGAFVTYTIRFQNTGTYPAENVRIEDELPSGVDPSSFQFVGGSAPCNWLINDGRLKFYFNGIMLPDSGTNEIASHGFVEFAIRPDAELPAGSEVTNSAAIRFDYNAPVITDPATFVIDLGTGLSETDQGTIHLWPVPATTSIHWDMPHGERTLKSEILDSAGRVLEHEANNSELPDMDVSRLAPGVYFLKVTLSHSVQMLRFIRS